MPAGHADRVELGAFVGPYLSHVKAPTHRPIRTVKDKGRAGDTRVKVTRVILKIILQRRTVIIAHAADHIRLAPDVLVGGQLLWPKILQPRRTPSQQA